MLGLRVEPNNGRIGEIYGAQPVGCLTGAYPHKGTSKWCFDCFYEQLSQAYALVVGWAAARSDLGPKEHQVRFLILKRFRHSSRRMK